jgi:hypothetical protein
VKLHYLSRVQESLGIAAAPARFLQETLPWHITYAGFTGTLPDILSMRARVHGVSYEDTLANMRCLFREKKCRSTPCSLSEQAA